MLASCTNGRSGGDLVLKDRLHYYKNDYDRRNGGISDDTVTNIYDPSYHDGFTYHVAWTAANQSDPIQATFPHDRRTFKVWGLSDGSAPDAPVSGAADFGGAEFKCYQGDQTKKWTTKDGFTCRAAFTCTRADRYIRATSVTFDKKAAQVGRAKSDCSHSTSPPDKATDVFAKLKDMASHSWDADKGIDIGGNCRMVFPSLLVPSSSSLPGLYDSSTPEKIAQVFVDAIGAEIEKKRTRDERNCWIPGSQLGGGSYYHVVQEGLVYPHGGKFEIQMAKQSDPKSLQIQTQVEFRIDCSCESDNGLMGVLQSSLGLVGWISPAFGVTAATVGLYNAATC